MLLGRGIYIGMVFEREFFEGPTHLLPRCTCLQLKYFEGCAGVMGKGRGKEAVK